ncbi:helix-turn-helix domain-containing protein [Pelagibius sp.]|uniref:helix-turn-helix domain-containing protein n=1 Tax=Pelagibius sp. TaxID=1931238 RepID=UPI003B509A1B
MRKSVHTEQYRVLITRLTEARTDAGLTQQQLADLLGRPQSFVAKYENGERRLDVVEFLEIAGQIEADPHAIIDLVLKTR